MNAHAQDQELARLIRNAMPLAPNEYGRVLSERLPIEAARTLRRAQMTLHRWSEEMCNGTIQREGPDGDGKPVRVWTGQLWSFHAKRMEHTERRTPCPDREAGALRRVAAVCKEAGLHFYHQTDPRGCQLYVAAFPLDHSNYDQGVACL